MLYVHCKRARKKHNLFELKHTACWIGRTRPAGLAHTAHTYRIEFCVEDFGEVLVLGEQKIVGQRHGLSFEIGHISEMMCV